MLSVGATLVWKTSDLFFLWQITPSRMQSPGMRFAQSLFLTLPGPCVFTLHLQCSCWFFVCLCVCFFPQHRPPEGDSCWWHLWQRQAHAWRGKLFMVNGALMDCVINNAYNSTAPAKSQKGLNACLHHSEKTGSTRYQEGKKREYSWHQPQNSSKWGGKCSTFFFTFKETSQFLVTGSTAPKCPQQ